MFELLDIGMLKFLQSEQALLPPSLLIHCNHDRKQCLYQMILHSWENSGDCYRIWNSLFCEDETIGLEFVLYMKPYTSSCSSSRLERPLPNNSCLGNISSFYHIFRINLKKTWLPLLCPFYMYTGPLKYVSSNVLCKKIVTTATTR